MSRKKYVCFQLLPKKAIMLNIFCCSLAKIKFCWLMFRSLLLTVGAWDYPSLSKDPIPVGWNSDWLARRSFNHWKACQEQAETYFSWDSRETCQGFKSSEICGMFSFNTSEFSLFLKNQCSTCSVARGQGDMDFCALCCCLGKLQISKKNKKNKKLPKVFTHQSK